MDNAPSQLLSLDVANKCTYSTLAGTIPQREMLFLVDEDGFVSTWDGTLQLAGPGLGNQATAQAGVANDRKVRWDEPSGQLIINYSWSPSAKDNGTRRLLRRPPPSNAVYELNIQAAWSTDIIKEKMVWERKTIRLLPEDVDSMA